MSIKNNISLIRSILYLQDVIRSGTISHTAMQNGIKPSNLSKLLSELEEALGCELLIRNTKGIFPTTHGQTIYNIAVELEKTLHKFENICQNHFINPDELNIYISESLDIPCLNEFQSTNKQLQLITCGDYRVADFAVLNHEPDNTNFSCTQSHIGNNIHQKIWIICNEKHQAALEIFDFIIVKLLS